MLKKMRWRFIGAAMLAFTAVVLVLLCAINLWNYGAVTRQQDDTLHMLRENDSKITPPFIDAELSAPGAFGSFSPEVRYMLRFFIVYCDENGQVQSVNQDHIASVSAAEAAEFAIQVLDGGKERGYHQGYRYWACATDSGSSIIFLNAEQELQRVKSLLWQTVSIATGSLIAVFLLVLALSKRAVAPYIRNIETQKRFITDAGHELKTPLTSISASADVLATEYAGDEWVENIQKQSLRLSKLIANLVTLSRLDEERPFPERAELSLSDAVWEISEPFASLAAAKGKEFIQHIEDGVLLTGDKSAIQQLVSILLDNAVKYSDEQGRIQLNVSKQNKRITITVYNTCALEKNMDVSRMFDRFYRADEAHSGLTGGTGIGLSIAKATAEAHGGKIKAESQNGNSLTVQVTL